MIDVMQMCQLRPGIIDQLLHLLFCFYRIDEIDSGLQLFQDVPVVVVVIDLGDEVSGIGGLKISGMFHREGNDLMSQGIQNPHRLKQNRLRATSGVEELMGHHYLQFASPHKSFMARYIPFASSPSLYLSRIDLRAFPSNFSISCWSFNKSSILSFRSSQS